MAIDAVWTEYGSLEWFASSAPAIGNGTLGFRYRRDGPDLHVAFFLEVGSTTTFGGTAWGFSLPFVMPAEAFSTTTWSEWTVAARAWDDSESKMYSGAGRISANVPPGAVGSKELPPTAYFLDFFFGQNVGRAGSATPFTWATGDILSAGGVLEGFPN